MKLSEHYGLPYERQFYTIYQKGKHKGAIYSFPIQRGPWCNSRLKIAARKGVIRKGDVEYIGIAYDEKKRHKIISKTKVAPLVDFQIDEDMCGLHCKYEGILSPSYETSYRDGCWFCHNQGVPLLKIFKVSSSISILLFLLIIFQTSLLKPVHSDLSHRITRPSSY